MKSRHLLALATGACLGLAGLGQTAFADRGNEGGDEERSRGCSADHENDSENEIAILGETDDDDGRGGDRESEVECSADHRNDSENSIGDSDQEGGLLSLVQIGSIASNGLSLSALNNALCGADVLNDADVAIL